MLSSADFLAAAHEAGVKRLSCVAEFADKVLLVFYQKRKSSVGSVPRRKLGEFSAKCFGIGISMPKGLG